MNLPNAMLLFWVLLVWWSEKGVFSSSLKVCDWGNWEPWPSDANPHHVVLLADPQIVDPHTYTGRPWPLSTLTEKHTDNYLRRSYKSLQSRLTPDTIFFLGDLFDGGREWATLRDDTTDPAWQTAQRTKEEAGLVGYWKKNYGEDFWMKEYERFGSIFFGLFNYGNEDAIPRPGQKGRKIIASLPGNHDLGFGAKIKIPVRDRFEAFFGEANRVDVFGNHTFVSVDSVSLSAGDDKSIVDNREVYAPVEEFLKDLPARKRRAVAQELKAINGEPTDLKWSHKVLTDIKNVKKADLEKQHMVPEGKDSKPYDFPSILLTHVPLYRAPETDCGPLREKGKAIAVAKGYQYQNVLSASDSLRLLRTIGNVDHVFSGDDHDYCELVHDGSNSGFDGVDWAKDKVREITVKSMSWAMGVRRPGFVAVSLWNPVDNHGKPIGGLIENGERKTIATKLCLLPDQIGMLIRYGILAFLSIIVLFVRAALTQIAGLPPSLPPPISSSPPSIKGKEKAEGAPLLPIASEKRDPRLNGANHSHTNSTTLSETSASSSHLLPRPSARTRSNSPAVGGYGLPASLATTSTPVYTPPQWDSDGEGAKTPRSVGVPSKGIFSESDELADLAKAPLGRFIREFGRAMRRVVLVVVVWFLYLAWTG